MTILFQISYVELIGISRFKDFNEILIPVIHMETCEAMRWSPWAMSSHLCTSPLLDYSCQKCISEHRSVATAVTSSTRGFGNVAVASLRWDWSFQIQKHRDHREAKMTEQRQEQTDESSTTDSHNPLQTHARQSQSGAVQYDQYVTTVSTMTLLSSVRQFRASTQGYFPLLSFPVAFL